MEQTSAPQNGPQTAALKLRAILDKAAENSILQVLALPITIALPLVLGHLTRQGTWIDSLLLQNISKTRLCEALRDTTFLLLVALAGHLLLLRQRRIPDAAFRFGLLWNKSKQPLCPRCSFPLTFRRTNYEYQSFDEEFACHKCGHRYTLRGDNGQFLRYEKAKEVL